MNDTRPLAIVAIRTILPGLMGALGAVAAMLFPAFHSAFCFGVV